MNISKLKLHSVGIVAEDKAKDSNEIEVILIEVTPGLIGNVEVVQNVVDVDVTNSSGDKKVVTLTFSNTVPATWLPTGDSNRLSSPDVVANEKVNVYQFGDTNQYFWVPHNTRHEFRKKETVIYGWASEDDPEATIEVGKNLWLFEVSTDKGYMQVTTTGRGGETYTYDIKLDANKGFTLQDNQDNIFEFDTENERFRFLNKSKTEIKMEKKEIYAYAEDRIYAVCDGDVDIKVKKTLTAKVKGETLLDCESKTFIKAPEIQLGEDSAVQPSVLGDNHGTSHQLIENQHNLHTHINALGAPTSVPIVPMAVPNAHKGGSDYSKVNTNQ